MLILVVLLTTNAMKTVFIPFAVHSPRTNQTIAYGNYFGAKPKSSNFIRISIFRVLATSNHETFSRAPIIE